MTEIEKKDDDDKNNINLKFNDPEINDDNQKLMQNSSIDQENNIEKEFHETLFETKPSQWELLNKIHEVFWKEKKYARILGCLVSLQAFIYSILIAIEWESPIYFIVAFFGMLAPIAFFLDSIYQIPIIIILFSIANILYYIVLLAFASDQVMSQISFFSPVFLLLFKWVFLHAIKCINNTTNKKTKQNKTQRYNRVVHGFQHMIYIH